MIDINNNPPRFFNDDTKKLIADESEAFLYCETCQDTNFGEIVEGKILKNSKFDRLRSKGAPPLHIFFSAHFFSIFEFL